MGWEKKPIDRMEMLHLLGIIYVKTASGFARVGLRSLIMKEAKPSVRGKVMPIIKALISLNLLLRDGGGRYRKYRWNLKKYGAVSIPIAEIVIAETQRQRNLSAVSYSKNRKARLSLTSNNGKTQIIP
jgi:hypothetical protein